MGFKDAVILILLFFFSSFLTDTVLISYDKLFCGLVPTYLFNSPKIFIQQIQEKKKKKKSCTCYAYLGEKLLLSLEEKSRTWEVHILDLSSLSLTLESGYTAWKVITFRLLEMSGCHGQSVHKHPNLRQLLWSSLSRLS